MFTLQRCEEILAEVLIPRLDEKLHLLLRRAKNCVLAYDSPCNCLVGTLFGERAAIDAVNGGTWLSDVDAAFKSLGEIFCDDFRESDDLRRRRIIPLINAEFARRSAERYESEAIVHEWADRVRHSELELTELIEQKRAEEPEQEPALATV